MTKKIILAGVLGGIAMFAWSSLAHMVLPLAATGIGEIPTRKLYWAPCTPPWVSSMECTYIRASASARVRPGPQ
ncbi:MAG: hypothetical protein ABSC02_07855 [Acidobacteriota bacterium]